MTRYYNYHVEEFATDEMFRSWVISPTPELTLIWKNWLIENPDKRAIVKQASELVLAVHEAFQDNLEQEKINLEILEITRLAVRRVELEKRKKDTGKFRILNYPVWKVAAIVFVTSGLGYLYNSNEDKKQLFRETQSVFSKNDRMLVKINNTNQELTILLNDNSVATLMKGSTLTYPSAFTDSERQVILNGEAFFDVAKNPEKPFLVFTNETVTKVLGTSFRVKAFEKDNTVMVAVKTGNVFVYQKNEYEMISGKNDLKNSGVALSPNQQVVFIKNQNRLEKSLIINPQTLSESAIQQELIFDDKPVAEVLHTLENIYGITILFDPETLNNCIINAQFDEENLKEKMNAICQAIGASYEMVDGQIVINSKGCS